MLMHFLSANMDFIDIAKSKHTCVSLRVEGQNVSEKKIIRFKCDEDTYIAYVGLSHRIVWCRQKQGSLTSYIPSIFLKVAIIKYRNCFELEIISKSDPIISSI